MKITIKFLVTVYNNSEGIPHLQARRVLSGGKKSYSEEGGGPLLNCCASGGLQRRAYEICHALHDARLAAIMPVALLNGWK